MRAVVQRVSSARVETGGVCVGAIARGFVVLLGVEEGDTPAHAAYMAEKCVHLRLFEDDAGKMNRSLQEVGGAILAVSNFTVAGDCRKGRRPSFTRAARPDAADALYTQFIECCRAAGVPVESGVFRADMQVHLVNDGPVTVIVDTAHLLRIGDENGGK